MDLGGSVKMELMPTARAKTAAQWDTSPETSFSLTLSGGSAVKQFGEALGLHIVTAQFGRALDEVLALVDPAHHIFSQVAEQAHLRIAAGQNAAPEDIGIASVAGDHAGQHERRLRALEQSCG